MNKIFSKVWSVSLGQMVVASELAKQGGHATTSQGSRSAAPLSLKVLVASVFLFLGGAWMVGMGGSCDGDVYLRDHGQPGA